MRPFSNHNYTRRAENFEQSISNQYGEEEAEKILNKELSEEQLASFNEALESIRTPDEDEIQEWIYSDEHPDGPAVGYIDSTGKKVIFDIHEDVEPMTDEEFAASMGNVMAEIARERVAAGS